MNNITPSPRTTSRITGMFVKPVDSDKCSLEIVTQFTEKIFDKKLNESNQEVIEVRILKQWETVDSYPMRKITVKELIKFRLSKVPGVVYKKDNLFFYGTIPGTLAINGKADKLGKHACGAQCTKVCNGCPRTTALTVPYQERIGKSFTMAVRDSWRIEKYKFIREGLETFNMDSANDAFIVLQCENYQMQTLEQRLPKKHTTQLKLGLAAFIWDGFNGTREEMLARIKLNERREHENKEENCIKGI